MFGRLGDVLGASRRRLAAAWGGLGAPLGIHGAIFWKFQLKLGRRWAQDGRSWWQVAPKMGHDSAKLGQDGAKMVSLRSTWEGFEAFWDYFRRSWRYVRLC